MGLNYSNKHQYLQHINCSYILHDFLANLSSSSTMFIVLILFFCFSKKLGVTYLTRCSTQTPQPPDSQRVAKSSLDVILYEKYSLQSSPWGSKTLSSSWPMSTMICRRRIKNVHFVMKLGISLDFKKLHEVNKNL